MESKRHSIKTVIKQTKNRHPHYEHGRTKKISQKIELKKQHFQCVINLNTTICEHDANQSELNKKTSCCSHRRNCESHGVSSVVRESLSVKSECNGRMAPYCFRDKCRPVVKQCRCPEIRKRRDHVRDKMARHHYHNSRKHRQDTQDSGRATRLPHRHRKQKNDSLKLSPISSSPLKDDLNHLYEDISNDSLDEVLETPLSYKNIRYVENKMESKLDTLIKRTKERERKQVAQSRSRPRYSFSSVSNMSSGECPMDLGTLDTVSLHSRSTLVLEKGQSEYIYLSSDSEKCQEYSRSPILRKYEYDQIYSPGSPSKSDFIYNVPRKYEHDRYSPGSPSKNDFIYNVPSKYEHDRYSPDFIMNVPMKYEPDFKIDNIKPKPEPMDIKTFSPTSDYSKMEIKKEIKI